MVNSTERTFDDVVTTPQTQGTMTATIRDAGTGGIEMGGDDAGARSGRRSSDLATADVRTNIAVATAQAYLAIIALKRRGRGDIARARHVAGAPRLRAPAARSRRRHAASTNCGPVRRSPRTRRVSKTRSSAFAARRKRSECSWRRTARPTPRSEPVRRFLRPSMKRDGWRSARICGCSPRRNARPIACGATARRTGSRPPSRRSNRRHSCPRAFSASTRSWRFVVNFTQPLFDGGQRAGLRRFREAEFNASRLALHGAADSGAIGSAGRAGGAAQQRARARQPALGGSAGDRGLEDHDVCVRSRRNDEPRSDRRAAAGARRGYGGRGRGTVGATRARLDLLTALGQFPHSPDLSLDNQPQRRRGHREDQRIFLSEDLCVLCG